jgi:hypothetical protein
VRASRLEGFTERLPGGSCQPHTRHAHGSLGGGYTHRSTHTHTHTHRYTQPRTHYTHRYTRRRTHTHRAPHRHTQTRTHYAHTPHHTTPHHTTQEMGPAAGPGGNSGEHSRCHNGEAFSSLVEARWQRRMKSYAALSHLLHLEFACAWVGCGLMGLKRSTTGL